ncbi:hypothetical protein TrLO_g7850 [Triparma laevis f. longispina]|uniref:RRM domain-containing protein n=1 Tax=Triparma laevis f. longispina TaxID=1714387 RepID=A0A9W7KY00_9STRA|nr:hypothetical protein TrLO_g7850 [Triparma laevis f. longispina]
MPLPLDDDLVELGSQSSTPPTSPQPSSSLSPPFSPPPDITTVVNSSSNHNNLHPPTNISDNPYSHNTGPMSRSLDMTSFNAVLSPHIYPPTLHATPIISVRTSLPSSHSLHPHPPTCSPLTKETLTLHLTSLSTLLSFSPSMSSTCASTLLPSLPLTPLGTLHILTKFFTDLNSTRLMLQSQGGTSRRSSMEHLLTQNTLILTTSFPWPVLDMASYENVARENYIPTETSIIGNLTFSKKTSKNIIFDNVIIISNLPKLKPNDSCGTQTVLKCLIDLLGKSMLMLIGEVESLCFPTEDGELNGNCFLEFENTESAVRAERILDNFKFYFGNDLPKPNLGCRRLTVYALNENLNSSLDSVDNLESSLEVDSPYSPSNTSNFSEEDNEEYDVDTAIADALAPLEQYKSSEFVKIIEERKKRAASQYAVGAAAIAAMRGGLDGRGKEEESIKGFEVDDDVMLRKAEREGGGDIQSTAVLLSNFETKLEEAIVRRNFKKVASHEKNITEAYGKIVGKTTSNNQTERNLQAGTFGAEGTLQMVLRLLDKTARGEGNDDWVDNDSDDSDIDIEDEKSEDFEGDEFHDERNLWRRCLQGERLRAAALLRRMKSSQNSYSRLNKDASKLRDEVKKMRRDFYAVLQANNVKHDQQKELIERERRLNQEQRREQARAVARMADMQRNMELSESRVRRLTLQKEESNNKRDELIAKLNASEHETAKWQRKERASRLSTKIDRDMDDESSDSDIESKSEEADSQSSPHITNFLKNAKKMLASLPTASESVLKELEASIDTSLLSVRQRREELLRIAAEEANSDRQKVRSPNLTHVIHTTSTNKPSLP